MTPEEDLASWIRMYAEAVEYALELLGIDGDEGTPLPPDIADCEEFCEGTGGLKHLMWHLSVRVPNPAIGGQP